MAGKTYTPLTDLPGTPVERCSQILANKLQCWRPGDFLVSEGGPPPTASGGSTPPAQQPAGAVTSPPQAAVPLQGSQPQSAPQGTGASATSSSSAPQAPPVTYQLCSMHKIINERAEKQGGDKALNAMLGVQLKKQQTPPSGKREGLPEAEPDPNKEYEEMMAPEDSLEYKHFTSKTLPELEKEEPGAETASTASTPASPSSPTSASTSKGTVGASKT